MNEENISGLSIYSVLNPTKDDIEIIFTPNEDVVSYSYRIFKNQGDNLKVNNNIVLPTMIYRDYTTINENIRTTISLDLTGVYKLEIVTTDINGNKNVINSGLYIIDKESPKINLSIGNKIDYTIGEYYSVFDGLSITDNYSGNITNQVSTNINDINLKKAGIKQLTYTISDEAGNVADKTVIINVTNNYSSMLHTSQIIILICLIPIMIFALIYNKAMKLEKRISKYSIEPIKKYTSSLFDRFLNIYLKIIDYIKKIISKSVFITKHSKKFDRYVGIVDNIHKDSMELIASKILVAFATLFLAIIIKTLRLKILVFEEFFIPFTLGYLSLNIYYILKYKYYRLCLENDLLQAIIVMNNAFKSGRSITQAIELVTKELDGPIAKEFNLMHMQLQFGISIDRAFTNFSERIKIEEVNYLTASLSILNKTGGNIIKVFSSIEKTLFNKKKLKLELKSLTGSSRIIMYLLCFLPVFLILVINFVSPSYFSVLYTNPIGICLMFLILIIYVSYIIVIRKIMKVRM